MKPQLCANCNVYGHVFKQCSKPILSVGILGFKVVAGEIQFLLVQRKDTMGYIDFLRGKYSSTVQKDKILKTLLEEMTEEERFRLRTLSFDKLWDDLWVNHNSRAYNNEKKAAKIKFESLDTALMVKNTVGKWDSQEYCIPKGRRNSGESKIDCAIREFQEETGISRDHINILDWSSGLSETFFGSNGIMYRHEYVLAEVNGSLEVKIDPDDIMMIGEIKDIKWFNFKDAINVFRDYDSTKRNVIYKARDIIKRYIELKTKKLLTLRPNDE